jgi:hypothetical protein
MTTDEGPDPHGGLDFGWRVHTALDSWTGKVDTKASITLAIESAILGFVITLSKKGERLAGLEGWSDSWYQIGIACLVAAVLFALLVVFPQLRRRQSKREWHSHMIYFGHLRHWEAGNLAAALKSKRTDEKQLAAQLVTMSQIAWRKHARLQWSIGFLRRSCSCRG